MYALQLRVENEVATQHEPFKIVLIAQGNSVEFDEIKSIAGYEVQSSSKVKNTLFINNSISHEVRLVLTIVPTSDFEIPPLGAMVDGVKLESKAKKIEVKPADSSQANAYFIQMLLDKTKAYLHQPIEVTVQLKELASKRLLDIAYSPPSQEGFYVKSVGKERSFTEGDFVVHELNYLYYPTKEGNLTIQAPKARIGIPHKTKDMFGQTTVPQHKTIAATDAQIEVKSLPQEVELVGDIELTMQVEPTKTDPNEPIYVDVIMQGAANYHDFIGFALDIDGVTVYEGDEQLNKNRYQKSFSMVAAKSFILPSFEVTIFNPRTKKVQTLTTKEQKIEIENTREQVFKKDEEIKADKQQSVGGFYRYLWFFFAGVVVGLIVAYFFKFKPKKREKQPLLKELLPYCNDQEVYETTKKVYEIEKGKHSGKIDKKKIKKLLTKCN